MQSDRIKSWPAEERPREKLLACGAESLSPAELLAVVLRVGQGTFQKGVASGHSLSVLLQDDGAVAERFGEDPQVYLTRPKANPAANQPNQPLIDQGLRVPTPLTAKS